MGSFPGQGYPEYDIAAQNTAGGEADRVQPSTVQYVDREETLLIVLGGCLSDEPPAINVLQMPAYKPPPALKAAVGMPPQQDGLSIADRKAFRDSFNVTGVSQYPTSSPAEDFILLPRSNPFFNLSFDPTAIVIFLTPDPKLPSIQGPHGSRSVDAWSFPPPRSDRPPDDTGRKTFHTVTDEALQGHVMADVPALPNQLPVEPAVTDYAAGGWRLPWSAGPASPGLGDLNAVIGQPPRALRLPSIFWTGATNVLGCHIYPLDTATFQKLIASSIENEGHEEKPRVPLHGGTAVPDLHSPHAPDPALIKMETHRILVTWHADGAVR